MSRTKLEGICELKISGDQSTASTERYLYLSDEKTLETGTESDMIRSGLNSLIYN